METPVITRESQFLKEESPLIRATQTKLSVIVVVNNVGESVRDIYSSLMEELYDTEEGVEYVFVDNGSSDSTWRELRAIADVEPGVKVIRLRATSGEAAAFDAGLRYSHGEKVIFLTSRVRINPAGIRSLLNKLDDGYDLVMGWRFPRGDSKLNQIISKVFNRLVNKLYRLDLHDINSGIFVAKREIFEEVSVYGNMNIFLPVLAAYKGFKVAEAQMEQRHGKFRQSNHVSEYIQRLLDIITVIFLMNYSKKPLHFLGFFGFIFTIAGVAMNVYLFIYRILGIGGIAGRPLLLLGALLLVIGVQMISIGLIGEMIIFTHAREVKEYSIETIIE